MVASGVNITACNGAVCIQTALTEPPHCELLFSSTFVLILISVNLSLLSRTVNKPGLLSGQRHLGGKKRAEKVASVVAWANYPMQQFPMTWETHKGNI